MTIIPARAAAQARVPGPGGLNPIHIHVGGERRRGGLTDLRFRFPEYPETSFSWPCLVEDPMGQPTRRALPCLLGMAGVVDDFDLQLDAKYVTLTRRRSWRGVLRRWWGAAVGLSGTLGLAAGLLLAKCRG